jgi:hypothetical protein
VSEALRAEPQDTWNTRVPAREVGDSLFIISTRGVCTVARFARLDFTLVADLGFRFAPPQALRYRHAPRAKAKTTDDELEQSFL